MIERGKSDDARTILKEHLGDVSKEDQKVLAFWQTVRMHARYYEHFISLAIENMGSRNPDVAEQKRFIEGALQQFSEFVTMAKKLIAEVDRERKKMR